MDMNLGTKTDQNVVSTGAPKWNPGGPPLKSWQKWKWTFIFILLKCFHLSPLLWKKPIQDCWMNLTCSVSSCTFCLHIQHWVITFLKTGTYNFRACVIKGLLKEALYFSIWNKSSTAPSRPFSLRVIGLSDFGNVSLVVVDSIHQTEGAEYQAAGPEATGVVSTYTSHVVSQLFISCRVYRGKITNGSSSLWVIISSLEHL